MVKIKVKKIKPLKRQKLNKWKADGVRWDYCKKK